MQKTLTFRRFERQCSSTCVNFKHQFSFCCGCCVYGVRDLLRRWILPRPDLALGSAGGPAFARPFGPGPSRRGVLRDASLVRRGPERTRPRRERLREEGALPGKGLRVRILTRGVGRDRSTPRLGLPRVSPPSPASRRGFPLPSACDDPLYDRGPLHLRPLSGCTDFVCC